jgi:hypothetical protein
MSSPITPLNEVKILRPGANKPIAQVENSSTAGVSIVIHSAEFKAELYGSIGNFNSVRD